MQFRFPLMLLAIAIPFLENGGNVHAQTGNPLRIESPVLAQPTYNSPESVSSTDIPPEVYQAIYLRNKENPQSLQATTDSPPTSQPIIDSNVTSAVYTEPLHASHSESDLKRGNLSTINDVLDGMKTNGAPPRTPSAPLNRLESSLGQGPRADLSPHEETAQDPDEASPSIGSKIDQQRFKTLMRTLATNTGIVLFVGVGFILVAKQWYKAKHPKPIQGGATIQIKSTLRLSPKANLFLVEAGEHRLIVACDQSGVKSVVPLSDSFAKTMGTMEDLQHALGDLPTHQTEPQAGPQTEPQAGPQAEPQTELKTERPTEPEASNESLDLYSLASLGKTQSLSGSGTHVDELDPQEEIRRKMEAALKDHGLKDLFLKTLRSQN